LAADGAAPAAGSAAPVERKGFYARTLRRLLDDGILGRDESVLVVCGGEADRDAFLGAGFGSVTISNLGERDEGAFRPYAWRVQDAEDLSFEDGAFDVVAVSAGLHHCRSPHRGLLEMYRVARRAVIVIESRDSALMRLGVHLGFVDAYELTAVAAHGFESGGVRDSSVPNYVYRWTEREVSKTIASQAPHVRPRIVFFHELELPLSVLDARQNPLWGRAARALEPALDLAVRVFPGQANLFAFVILKPRLPGDLQPWIRLEQGAPVPDEAWIRRTIAAPPDDPDGE
jgi:SAM-dependent methyltransferase